VKGGKGGFPASWGGDAIIRMVLRWLYEGFGWGSERRGLENEEKREGFLERDGKNMSDAFDVRYTFLSITDSSTILDSTQMVDFSAG